jgi:D-lactate dehydrogenase
MNISVFSTKSYDRASLATALEASAHQLRFFKNTLSPDTAKLAQGCEAVCVFVNDQVDADVIAQLAAGGTRLIVLRCAGFNNVDLAAAKAAGIAIGRVPAYSPYAVAEHVLALVLTLNRKTHRAYNRVREGNFSIEGLLGFDLHGKTVGLIGMGKIGEITARIFLGFGCRVLVYDVAPRPEVEAMGVSYASLEELFAQSDIISLHCPLLESTHHLINDTTVSKMKNGVMIINTSRGALIDTDALYRGLKNRKIGSVGLDVYEEEQSLFFQDHSLQIIDDDRFMRLMTFPNVLVTGHQAFFTDTALKNIADTTRENIDSYASTGTPAFPVE